MADNPLTRDEKWAWRWWVVRDDGDRCSGPWDSREEAARALLIFDPSEYRIDYQFNPEGTGIARGTT